jgi:hypothetical protein
MLYPARVREELLEFLLNYLDYLTEDIKDDGS